MNTLTLTKNPTEITTEFDRPDGDLIADEMLLESASSTRPGKVSGGRGARQSADARAWTRAGNVD